jgi:hypothetical protein
MKLLTAVCFLVCGGISYSAHAQATPATAATTNWVQTKSGLAYQTIVRGTGPVAARGQRVTIHETLTLLDGKVVFSSRAPANRPVTFELGANQVIAGVDEGVTGMRVGERRKLLVPPALDGRTFDASLIPPQAIRQYDIELLAILPSARPVTPASPYIATSIAPTGSLDCAARMAAVPGGGTTTIEAAKLDPGNRMPNLPLNEPRTFAVSIVVDSVGRADPATLKTPEGVDAATVGVLRTVLAEWRFSPARLSGCPVKQAVRLTFTRPMNQ